MAASQMLYEFGEFVLDTGQQRLTPRAGGEPVVLAGKTFDTLLYLVEHAGEALDRDTLLAALWPGVIVEENSLTQVISTLRRLLGESRGEHRYIVTLPRKGYRFVAAVTTREHASAARNWRWVSGAALALLIASLAVFGSHWLTNRPSTPPLAGETTSPEAFAAYASGRYAYLRLTEPSLLQAIAFYERAITLDPQYARAYAGIADSNALLAVLGVRADYVYPKARAAAEKAITLNPRLAAAHVSLGQILMLYYRDEPRAAHEYARAIELDPNYAPAYFYRATLLSIQGNIEQAFNDYEHAVQLDPNALASRAARALMLVQLRRYSEAIESLRQILALDDRFDLARSFLIRALLAKGDYQAALNELNGRTLHAPGSYGFAAQALALSGQQDAARAELDRILELSKQQHVPAYDIAMIYAALNDSDQAFRWLDRAIDDTSPVGPLQSEPLLEGLRADPRFTRLVEKIRSPRHI